MPDVGALFGAYAQLYHDDFFRDLRKKGHTVHARYAEGDSQPGGKLDQLAAELVGLSPCVITTADTPAAYAAVQARDAVGRTDDIAIVMSVVSNVDQVWPGGLPTNVCALTDFPQNEDRSAIRLQLLIQLLSNPQNPAGSLVPNPVNVVAVIVNEENPGLQRELDRTTNAGAASVPRIDVKPLFVQGPDWDASLDAALNSIDVDAPNAVALMVIAEPVLFQRRAKILEFVRRRNLPDFWEGLAPVTGQGLICWGVPRPTAYTEAAKLIDQLCKGTRSVVGQPLQLIALKTSDVFINADIAGALKIAVPEQLTVPAVEKPFKVRPV